MGLVKVHGDLVNGQIFLVNTDFNLVNPDMDLVKQRKSYPSL